MKINKRECIEWKIEKEGGMEGGRERRRQEGIFQVDAVQEMRVAIFHHLSF